MKRLVVGMTGATGAVLGVRLLQELRRHGGVEVHLVLSRWARITIATETDLSAREVAALADFAYGHAERGAVISSSSFHTDGAVIIPCSMKTLAAIRMGDSDGLVARAADVTLKERRKLVLVPRETPLGVNHLEDMLALAKMGAIVVPPMPAFYHRPTTADHIVDAVVGEVLGQFGLDTGTSRRPHAFAPTPHSIVDSLRPAALRAGPTEGET